MVTPFLFLGNTFKFYAHREQIGDPQLSDRGVDRMLAGRPLYLRPGPILIAIALLAVLVNATMSHAKSDPTASTPATLVSSSSDETNDLEPNAAETSRSEPVATTTPSVVRASLSPGDCFDMSGMILVPERVTPVSCADRHRYELYARDALVEPSYPGETVLDERASEYCYQEFEPYVGTSYERSTFEVVFLTPTASGWQSGDRTVECLITGAGLVGPSPLVGAARASGR